MSTSLIEIKGYRMDCSEETIKNGYLDFDSYEQYFDDYFKEKYLQKHPEDTWKFQKLKELNFVFYANIDFDFHKDKFGFFTFIQDGRDGRYSWLVYVENGKRTRIFENIEEDTEKNIALAITHKVPKEIDEKMRKIYEIIFNTSIEESSKKKIRYQDMRQVV